MQYGLALPNGGVCGDAATLAELAALAEASGWDGIFLEDYIVFQNHADLDFTAFGENLDNCSRARQLDEALEILNGLWSVEPFSYQGEHYQVNGVTCLPRPLQQPRIPIWIGGGYPLKGPTERALRWDGSCLYQHVAEGEDWRDWTPEDIRSLKARAEVERAATTPFDLAPGGRERKDPAANRELLRSLADAGATWWIEYVPAADRDVMVEGIKRGPLRID